MRIVQINTFSYKATGTIMLNIHRWLQKRGYESYIVWGRGREPQNQFEYSIYDNLGIKFHGIYTRVLDKTGFASWNATKKLIAYLDKIKPDIIHLHNLHGYYLNIDMLFSYIKSKNIPVVWTLHDCWALTGHCAYFSAVGCSKWKTGCNQCPQKNTYPISMIKDNSEWNWKKKKELYKNLRLYVVTVSKWLNCVVADSILNQYPTRTIYNGLDLEVFSYKTSNFRTKTKLNNRFIILGVASEWTERKGLMDFIELSKVLDDRFQIVLIGLTKKQINAIRDTSIWGMERTSNIDELVEIYSASDVFLNLSVEETMGMTTIEAMACGTPSIVYNCTALPEILSDFPEHIIEPHDIFGVKDILNKMISNPKNRELYRNATLKYNAALKNEEYVDLYNSIIEREKYESVIPYMHTGAL